MERIGALVFVDFWNFSLNWGQRNGKARVDWPALPRILFDHAMAANKLTGHSLQGARVYCSYDPSSANQGPLRNWLSTFLSRQPGITVYPRERHPRPRPFRCRECEHEMANCPACKVLIKSSAEKGVDAAIVTDMLALAWDDAYGVAILVSSDSDFIPAVQRLQDRGFKIINATWKGYGHQLASECWASFNIDDLATQIVRS